MKYFNIKIDNLGINDEVISVDNSKSPPYLKSLDDVFEINLFAWWQGGFVYEARAPIENKKEKSIVLHLQVSDKGNLIAKRCNSRNVSIDNIYISEVR